jgi:hypothetical protein
VLLDSGLSVAPTEPFMEELEETLGGVPVQFDYPRDAEMRPNGNGHSNGGGNGHGAPHAGAYGSRGENGSTLSDGA